MPKPNPSRVRLVCFRRQSEPAVTCQSRGLWIGVEWQQGTRQTDCRPAGDRLRRHRVAMGTSPQPLAYAMGADGDAGRLWYDVVFS